MPEGGHAWSLGERERVGHVRAGLALRKGGRAPRKKPKARWEIGSCAGVGLSTQALDPTVITILGERRGRGCVPP